MESPSEKKKNYNEKVQPVLKAKLCDRVKTCVRFGMTPEEVRQTVEEALSATD